MSLTGTKVWGLHMGEHVGTRPIDEGYVAIGWHELGNLQQYADRNAFKAAISEKIPKQVGSGWPTNCICDSVFV